MSTATNPDVEVGQSLGNPVPDEEQYDGADEHEALLPMTSLNNNGSGKREMEFEDHLPSSPKAGGGGLCVGTKKMSGVSYYARLIGAFVVGVLCTVLMHLIITRCTSASSTSFRHVGDGGDVNAALAPPYVGSSEAHQFPPASPTNKFPEYFPSDVGYAGATPTGAEAGIVATAPMWPMHTGAPHLVVPGRLGKNHGHGSDEHGEKGKGKGKKRKFNILEKWGNLSPWYSIERGGFGLDSEPGAPETCVVTGLHLLHRHGARYPTNYASYGGPSRFANKLHNATAQWGASGQLDFLNDWRYKLGAELLTPFGRQQLYDLGVTTRLKYGFLLKNFSESNTIPVFRTESQDRMLSSAMNFALGFFGWPLDGQYEQSITIEANGFNNTLAPYKTCPNANIGEKAERGLWYIRRWADIYLAGAKKRLQTQITGLTLETADVYSMQQLCAYETVALGYSKFCELFTEEEWEGFNYALDLFYWYNSAFGSPVARVQGIGWIQELVARLTHTPIAVHNSSTNSTLNDSPITFPLDQSLYVDATHEVVVLNIVAALGLSTFAEQGPLPYTHIVEDRKFRSSEIAPFATNVQFQLLECTSVPGPQIRIIINDGVVPMTGIKGCPEQKDGMCPVDNFVQAMKENIKNTDWVWDCHGNWTVPEGTAWNTTTGDSPKA